MAVYCSLLLSQDRSGPKVLKQWLMKMGAELHAGDPLFTYQDGSGNQRFLSAGDGTLKVYLYREGDTLAPGSDVAVLSMVESQAQDLQRRGLGKILSPEELKSALEHAEAASIRLPHDEV